MPKKTVNDKREEAREREATKKSAAASKAKQEAEDAYWRAAGEGEKGKAAARREEEERKRADQAAKRAELKRLAEEEEARLAASSTKAKLAPAGTQKVTKYQLDRQRELEEQLRNDQLRERELAAKREVDANAYERALESHINTNRAAAEAVDARSVEGALAALGVADTATDDKHPEKRMKVAWKTYEAAQLAALRAEKPGLKLNQYRELIWKAWQKAPENPMNQAAAAGSSKA